MGLILCYSYLSEAILRTNSSIYPAKGLLDWQLSFSVGVPLAILFGSSMESRCNAGGIGYMLSTGRDCQVVFRPGTRASLGAVAIFIMAGRYERTTSVAFVKSENIRRDSVCLWQERFCHLPIKQSALKLYCLSQPKVQMTCKGR